MFRGGADLEGPGVLLPGGCVRRTFAWVFSRFDREGVEGGHMKALGGIGSKVAGK